MKAANNAAVNKGKGKKRDRMAWKKRAARSDRSAEKRRKVSQEGKRPRVFWTSQPAKEEGFEVVELMQRLICYVY
jgi:hypothetical protein